MFISKGLQLSMDITKEKIILTNSLMNNNLKEKIAILGRKGIGIAQIHDLHPECSITEIQLICDYEYNQRRSQLVEEVNNQRGRKNRLQHRAKKETGSRKARVKTSDLKKLSRALK